MDEILQIVELTKQVTIHQREEANMRRELQRVVEYIGSKQAQVASHIMTAAMTILGHDENLNNPGQLEEIFLGEDGDPELNRQGRRALSE